MQNRMVRSTHIRTLPSLFGTTTIPEHQFVGLSTREITPIHDTRLEAVRSSETERDWHNIKCRET
jgi:hypothetical protein